MTAPSLTMTRKQKRMEEYALHVSQDTRDYAAWWLRQFRNQARHHGYRWHAPFLRDTSLGEVLFYWETSEPYTPHRKTLSIYVEVRHEPSYAASIVTYLRHWDTDGSGKNYTSEEGECQWFDHALLLWHWLST